MWNRPPPTPKITSKDPTKVGEYCECDFKYFEGAPCFHVIDWLIKFHDGDECPDRGGEPVRDILRRWFRVAKMQDLYTDGEGSVGADEMGIWLERRGCERHIVSKDTHLNLVERHGEV